MSDPYDSVTMTTDLSRAMHHILYSIDTRLAIQSWE